MGDDDDDDEGSLAHLCRIDHVARRGLLWLFLEHTTQQGLVDNKTIVIQSALLDSFTRCVDTMPVLAIAYAALVRAECDGDTLMYIRQCNAPHHTLHWLVREMGSLAPCVLIHPHSIAYNTLIKHKVIVIWPCGFV